MLEYEEMEVMSYEERLQINIVKFVEGNPVSLVQPK